MTTFAGIKSTEALKKTSGSTATPLYEHCVQVFYKKGCFECQCFYKFWCPLVFSPSRLRPCRIYFLFAWYVWLWDVRIKWSPSSSGGLRHKHKATSVSLLLTASWRCWLVYTWIMTMNHAVINAEFAVCLFTMSASASLLKSFSRFTSCSPISWEVSLHRRRVHICPRVCY